MKQDTQCVGFQFFFNVCTLQGYFSLNVNENQIAAVVDFIYEYV